jgi:adenylate cyclase
LLIRRLRLASGLVLFAYLLTHFANHALGLVSLAAMEWGLGWFLALWRNPLASAALYGSLAVHLGLAFWSLYRRHHLRMPVWEALQLALGLLIPPLLVAHIIGNRVAHELFGVTDAYTRTVLTLWVVSPMNGLKQAILLAVAWTHGCMGLHFWLRFYPAYRQATPALLSFSVMVPALALLGFSQAGQEVEALARTPGWLDGVRKSMTMTSAAERAVLEQITHGLTVGFVAALGFVVIARAGRRLYQRRSGTLTIGYPGGRRVIVPRGYTVLEASRLAGIPHASMCGGRGRCSTCRVRIVQGVESLPRPTEAERRVLHRVKAPPLVRLACQLKPARNLAVVPVLPPAADLAAITYPEEREGQEREIAVLFADLRGFTRLTEHKLPYDVVFILNRYFATIDTAIGRAGGIANQFMGDGVMALFGVETPLDEACRQALAAARDMLQGLAELSRELAEDLPEPLRMGIGIHCGSAVVGHMGSGVNMYLTAVGDTVHVAARLEQATKDYGCELVVSEEVGRRAGLDLAAFPREDLAVRNRAAEVPVRIIQQVSELTMPGAG